jgi:hypothetical protein
MNTATHDITTAAAGAGNQYADARVGAGRVDVKNAVLDNVIAYNAEDAGAVSVSFGSVQVPVDGTANLYKQFVVANKNGNLNGPVTFNVAYVPAESLDTPGVSFAVEDTSGNPVTSITLKPGETQHLRVHLTANGALMRHNLDKTMSSQQTSIYGALTRYWMSEAGGLVTLALANAQVETVRLPVYAAARPVSNMQGDAAVALPGTKGDAQVNLSGVGINTGTNYPSDVVSLVSALELKAISPKLQLSNPIFAADDFQYVGVMSDYNHVGGSWDDTNIYFGFSTYGNWTTPDAYSNEYDIWIDTNRDGKPDFLVVDAALPDAVTNGNQTDIFYSYVEKVTVNGDGSFSFTSLGFSTSLNGIDPSFYDTSVYNTNVMVLPVSNYFLGLSDANTSFNFWLTSYSSVGGYTSTSPIDKVGSATQPLTYDAKNLAIDTTAGLAPNPSGLVLPPVYPDIQAGSPLCAGGSPFVLAPCGTIPFNYNKANAPEGGIMGLLLLHHHNGEGARAQVITVLTKQIYLPVISTP